MKLFLCSDRENKYLSPSDRNIYKKLVRVRTCEKLNNQKNKFQQEIKGDEIKFITRSCYLWQLMVELLVNVINLFLIQEINL